MPRSGDRILSGKAPASGKPGAGERWGNAATPQCLEAVYRRSDREQLGHGASLTDSSRLQRVIVDNYVGCKSFSVSLTLRYHSSFGTGSGTRLRRRPRRRFFSAAISETGSPGRPRIGTRFGRGSAASCLYTPRCVRVHVCVCICASPGGTYGKL